MLAGSNPVLEVAAASAAEAERRFAASFAFDTDCWDVHAALALPEPGFVLLDVRGPDAFVSGHLPGAVNLPHGRIVARNLEVFGQPELFVVYCAGPHCNGADRAALRLARLGRPVKRMLGGVTGWLDEGFALQQ
jgi:rhodanese-related sulfurtransferase